MAPIRSFRRRPAPPVLLPAFANWLMPVTPLCHPAGRLQSAGWVIPVVRLGPPGAAVKIAAEAAR